MSDKNDTTVGEAIAAIVQRIGLTGDPDFWFDLLAGVRRAYDSDIKLLRGLEFEVEERKDRSFYSTGGKYIKIADPSVDLYRRRRARRLELAFRQQELTNELAETRPGSAKHDRIQHELVALDAEMEKLG